MTEAVMPESTGNRSNIILFLVASVAVVVIASLVVVHMPDQFKKIFLLSIAYCVVVTFALRFFAANMQIPIGVAFNNGNCDVADETVALIAGTGTVELRIAAHATVEQP